MATETHLRLSLLLLTLFLGFGLVLEAILGLRLVAWQLEPLGREFLRLGHAHGGLLALLNLGLGWSLERLRVPEPWARPSRLGALLGALCVGGGFLGGGLWHGLTDPGPPVLLAPLGALLLLPSLSVAFWPWRSRTP